jgi:hypothetical protein
MRRYQPITAVIVLVMLVHHLTHADTAHHIHGSAAPVSNRVQGARLRVNGQPRGTITNAQEIGVVVTCTDAVSVEFPGPAARIDELEFGGCGKGTFAVDILHPDGTWQQDVARFEAVLTGERGDDVLVIPVEATLARGLRLRLVAQPETAYAVKIDELGAYGRGSQPAGRDQPICPLAKSSVATLKNV